MCIFNGIFPKKISFWGTSSSPRPPNGALPLDPAGDNVPQPLYCVPRQTLFPLESRVNTGLMESRTNSVEIKNLRPLYSHILQSCIGLYASLRLPYPVVPSRTSRWTARQTLLCAVLENEEELADVTYCHQSVLLLWFACHTCSKQLRAAIQCIRRP